ncbi:MAG: septum formation initiator family protein [Lachnospiraceae bacterium]|nr:septum formation initiator family protein [Lachnospiraceae bacterium]
MKRKTRSRLAKFTVLGLLVLVFVACGILGFGNKELDTKKQVYQAQYSELISEQEKLKQNDEEIKNYEDYTKSRRYIENMARQKLGLVYPGEVVFEPDDK